MNVSMHISDSAVLCSLDRIIATVDIAGERAVQTAAVQTRMTAAANTRVYSGTDRRAPPGRMRDSIAVHGAGMTATIGPRGMPVLYSRKLEKIQPFMAPGREAGAAMLPELLAHELDMAMQAAAV